MKPVFTLLIILFFTPVLVKCQNKVNYWMGGMGSMIKFEGDTAYFQNRPDASDFWRTSSSVSDSAGNLLFYTNAYRVFNATYQVMPGGDKLDIGDYVNWGSDLLSTGDGALILPVPGQADKYYLFHTDLNLADVPEGEGGLWPTHIFYCLIDMTLNGDHGGILAEERDVVVLNDSLTQMGMKAVKHGNGRDWWVLCHEYGSNRYYRFLIDPYGIHGPYSQYTGIEYKSYNAQVSSPMKFYTDGETFAQLSRDSNIVELYNFNRCSGELYNYRKIKINDNIVPVRGLSFSPGGRYLYLSSNFNEVLQFDLAAVDISSSRIIVGTDDGIMNPFPANYYYQELGPDGKIYIQSYDATYSLHVINQPDSAGLKCGFVQRGFVVNGGPAVKPNWSPVAPNAPNYSLGPLAECDTITGIAQYAAPVFTWGTYPNPFKEELNISITGAVTETQVTLYNVLGQQLYYEKQHPDNYFVYTSITLPNLAAGIYIVKVQVNGKQYERKVVKQ